MLNHLKVDSSPGSLHNVLRARRVSRKSGALIARYSQKKDYISFVFYCFENLAILTLKPLVQFRCDYQQNAPLLMRTAAVLLNTKNKMNTTFKVTSGYKSTFLILIMLNHLKVSSPGSLHNQIIRFHEIDDFSRISLVLLLDMCSVSLASKMCLMFILN